MAKTARAARGEFGEKVREHCKSVALSHNDLADELNMSPGGLHELLFGREPRKGEKPRQNEPNILQVKAVIRVLALREAIISVEEALGLLTTAYPGQPLMQRFTPSEKKQDWYVQLLANSLGDSEPYLYHRLGIPEKTLGKKLATATTAFPVVARPAGLIPPSLTTLLCREEELATCLNLLQNEKVRLLNLVGPGGVGKTQLVLEIANNLEKAGAFEDGIIYKSLDFIYSGVDLAPALCETIGLTVLGDDGELAATRVFLNFLRAKHILLVLDNFEQLIDEVSLGLLNALLSQSQNLQILLTSRRVLRLKSEHVFRVPTLPLPPKGKNLAIEELLKYGAVNLFVRAARRADCSKFIFDQENADQVVELCHRLDGLPLMLELAGSKIARASLQEMLSRNRATNLLYDMEDASSDLPKRHSNIVEAMDWSYQLLTDEEKLLFSRLAVFRNGGDLDAIIEICFGDEQAQSDKEAEPVSRAKVRGLLGSLIDQSIVKVELSSGGNNRYLLLETIWDYAQITLEALGVKADWVRNQYANYYLGLARQAEPFINQQANEEWLTKLKRDKTNLTTALEYFIDTGKAEKAFGLAAALGPYWFRSRLFLEGTKWIEKVLGMCQINELPDVFISAELLHQAGRLYNNLKDYDRAMGLFETAEKLWRKLHEPIKLALTLSGLGNIAYRQEDYDKAYTFYIEELELTKQTTNNYALHVTLMNLGNIAQTRGCYDEARIYFQDCLVVNKKLNNISGIAKSLQNLGTVAKSERKYEVALTLYQESFQLYKNLSSYQDFAQLLLHLTNVNFIMGDYESFISHTLLVSSIVRDHNISSFIPFCLLNFSAIFGIIIYDRNQTIENLKFLERINLKKFDQADEELYALVKETVGFSLDSSTVSGFSISNKTQEGETAECWQFLDEQINCLQNYGKLGGKCEAEEGRK